MKYTIYTVYIRTFSSRSTHGIGAEKVETKMPSALKKEFEK